MIEVILTVALFIIAMCILGFLLWYAWKTDQLIRYLVRANKATSPYELDKVEENKVVEEQVPDVESLTNEEWLAKIREINEEDLPNEVENVE